jgi:hypothetical protein
MSEPTIDEMLAWLESAHSQMIASDNEEYVDAHYDGSLQRTVDAIRAILDLHRLPAFTEGMEFGRKQGELTTIRAFVERVKKRAQDDHFKGQDHAYAYLVDAELAAMERETQTQ